MLNIVTQLLLLLDALFIACPQCRHHCYRGDLITLNKSILLSVIGWNFITKYSNKYGQVININI